MRHVVTAAALFGLACATARPAGGDCAAAGEAPLAREPTRDEVLCVVRAHRADVDACRAEQQRSAAAVEGTATVALLLLPSGRTSSVTVAPEAMAVAPLGTCLVTAVRGWTFRPFTGRPVPVDFPVPTRAR